MARRGVQEMLGEFFREAAVLVMVFGFLDELLAKGEVTLGYSFVILSASGFGFLTGVVAELTREE